MLIAFYIKMEMLACIHRKPVNHNLSEQTMILIGFQKSLDRTKAPALTEVAIDRFEARTEQTGRNDEHIHKDIDNPDIYNP